LANADSFLWGEELIRDPLPIAIFSWRFTIQPKFALSCGDRYQFRAVSDGNINSELFTD
jgi:hypothetical protein